MVRPAIADNRQAIHALVRAARINPIGLDWRRFKVAIVQDGEVIGCGQVKPHIDGSHELASIVVVPSWRGQSVARAIISHLIEMQPGPLYLMCISKMGGMYEKFGFRAISENEMPKYFRRISRLAGLVEWLQKDGEELLVMKRNG